MLHIAHLTELNQDVRNANVIGHSVAFHTQGNQADNEKTVLVGVIT